MQQLSPTDSQMLYIECPEAPNHVAPLMIYDPSTAPGGVVTHKGILETLASRLDIAPTFRRKLVRVPLDIDEPYWVDDSNFDLEYHVRHLALPKPGDWRQLCILVARLVARPLDPSRPLWEMNIIEGLDHLEGYPPGCFAILMKIHHSMVDGKAGAAIINALHDMEPIPIRVQKETTPWVPESAPSPWKLANIGMRRILFKPGHFFKVATRNLPSKVFSKKKKPKKKDKIPLRVPHTPLNGKLTAPRVFDSLNLPLDSFKAIRTLVANSTINDVALAVVGGGMHKYLSAKNQLPHDPLVASVPISVRSKETVESQTQGNELIIQNIFLHTDIADSQSRFEAITESMQDTKGYISAVGAKSLSDLSTAIPGRVAGLLAHAMSTVADMTGDHLMANTVVTNVPGAQIPLYMNGAKMLYSGGCGPLNAHIGIIHIISSYNGTMGINITACRDLLPDPEFYMQCMKESFDELYTAATGESFSSNKSKPAAKKTTAKKAPIRKSRPKKTAPIQQAKPATTDASATRTRKATAPKLTTPESVEAENSSTTNAQ